MARPSILPDSSHMTDYKGIQFDAANYRWQIAVEVGLRKFAFGSYRMDETAARGHDLVMELMGREQVNRSTGDLTSPEARELVDEVRDRLGGIVELRDLLKLSAFAPDMVRRISWEPYRNRIKQLDGRNPITEFIEKNGDLEMYYVPRLDAWMGLAIVKRISSLCVYTLQDFGPDRGMR